MEISLINTVPTLRTIKRWIFVTDSIPTVERAVNRFTGRKEFSIWIDYGIWIVLGNFRNQVDGFISTKQKTILTLSFFRCSRCKVRLNTDAEDGDTKHSKAFLGEDYALRCNHCNELFEDKKMAKSAFIKRPDLLNYHESELMKYKLEKQRQDYLDEQLNDHHLNEHQLNRYHRHQQFNVHFNADEKRTHPKCSNCVGHRCLRNKKCSLDRHSGDKRCSIDKQRLNDKKCSLVQRNYLNNGEAYGNKEKVFNNHKVLNDQKANGQPNTATTAKTDSAEIYRSLFKGRQDQQIKANKNLICNCTGCRKHMNKV